MPIKAIYKPVSGNVDDDEQDAVIFEIDEFDEDHAEDAASSTEDLGINGSDDNEMIRKGDVQPMEISSHSFSDDDFTEHLFRFQDPWVPSVLVTLCLVVPVLLGNIWAFHDLFGAWFVSTLFALHLLFTLCTARHLVGSKLSVLSSRPSRIYTSIAALVDIVLLGALYPVIWKVFIEYFFTEVDGTTSIEWSGYKTRLQSYRALAVLAVVLRSLLGVNSIGLRAAEASMESSFSSTPTFLDRYCTCPNYVVAPFLYLDSRLNTLMIKCSVSLRRKRRIRQSLTWLFNVAIVLAALLVGCCLYSALKRIGRFNPPVMQDNADCDPLDESECWLPFPSFHSMKADATTDTGWRVSLQGRLLPPLKGGAFMQPEFLWNDFDGFSTMAPMLFYLDGLKEAHEAGIGQLKGARRIAESVTPESATLLVNVDSRTLVPHSAEIDYLDGKNPLVMIFPSRPLHHNCHYAVALINATDANRERLPPTRGMQDLFAANQTRGSTFDVDRKTRYIDVVIPAIEKAASWFAFSKDPDSLQLLFDFKTISEESQLGPVRRVRDATIEQISSAQWDWKDHARTIRQVDYDCAMPEAILARTIHAELDVPWFMMKQGSGARTAFLDDEAVKVGKSNSLGSSKFLVNIPCSLKAAALDSGENAKELRAVMEYGHGLFGNRDEALDEIPLQIAHNEGYVITAMDWRGMSSYDQLIVVKVLISSPRLFQAVRDNLIQGFANKFALQHFSRHEMLSMDWFTFDQGSEDNGRQITSRPVPTLENKPPAQVFYGISQGGILGAGYTALSGTTGLIDRAALGSPGTPFALILTRSIQFLEYDKLLLFDFYDNRHVRMCLSLVQMAWDSVEASGVLALPVNEPYPRVLIQAGLGDSIVPALASEALGRAFNASSLPNNPRAIFGISNESAAQGSSNGPYATLTEVMFDNEYLGLPTDNIISHSNPIHVCLRHDTAMIAQLTEFLNTGRIIDPCTSDGCHRTEHEIRC